MRYVRVTSDGAIDLRAYEAYLERERPHLAARIAGADLLSGARFDLSDRGSFHDARLLELRVGAEVSEGSDRALRVELALRGPWFDRRFLLRYRGVSACRVVAPAPRHDLLVHEVTSDGPLLVHELLFDGGGHVAISAEHVAFEEILGGPPRDGSGPGPRG